MCIHLILKLRKLVISINDKNIYRMFRFAFIAGGVQHIQDFLMVLRQRIVNSCQAKFRHVFPNEVLGIFILFNFLCTPIEVAYSLQQIFMSHFSVFKVEV